ncbi:hypothetical protein BK816_08390 [Boudabousia tangfeifanii]|uniref:Uncharacterized protein n=1 Tax=Boudabousia tangfeifanii TaxID=1912795 RepID=A0A1D9MMA0_9ACTO|nr:hypothetical protein [Boudabousia tangfeifanii]AOZ73293.1 hypothetical protein BK816_08390 [Boudabousia tangfeifanii]
MNNFKYRFLNSFWTLGLCGLMLAFPITWFAQSLLKDNYFWFLAVTVVLVNQAILMLLQKQSGEFTAADLKKLAFAVFLTGVDSALWANWSFSDGFLEGSGTLKMGLFFLIAATYCWLIFKAFLPIYLQLFKLSVPGKEESMLQGLVGNEVDAAPVLPENDDVPTS